MCIICIVPYHVLVHMYVTKISKSVTYILILNLTGDAATLCGLRCGVLTAVSE